MSSTFAPILLTLECYHLVAHVLVMMGWRQLPRKDLVRQRFYFLIDLATVFLSFLVHQRWWALILAQNLQHAYYFITWEKR